MGSPISRWTKVGFRTGGSFPSPTPEEDVTSVIFWYFSPKSESYGNHLGIGRKDSRVGGGVVVEILFKNFLAQESWLFVWIVQMRKAETVSSLLPSSKPSNSLTSRLLPNVHPPHAKANSSFGSAFELAGTPLASADKVIQLCSPTQWALWRIRPWVGI